MKIFEYSDYRKLLEDRFGELQLSGMTYRSFSMKAGFSAPNYLQLLIKGQRNLSLEGCHKVAKGLGFNAPETHYFEVLVQANQSQDIEQKRVLTEKLIKMKANTLPKKDNLADYNYYRYWCNIPIREAFLIKSQKPMSASDLAKAFWPKVSKQEVADAIKTLLDLKMIKKEKGRYVITGEETLHTKDFIMHSLMINFHTKMLELAAQSIHEVPSQERELGGVTVALSKKGFEEARAIVKEFKQKILDVAERDKNKSDVYQVGFQLFPLTRGLGDEE